MAALVEVKGLKKYFQVPRGMLHAVDDVTSVSYTHLDVYKRQIMNLTRRLSTTRNSRAMTAVLPGSAWWKKTGSNTSTAP